MSAAARAAARRALKASPRAETRYVSDLTHVLQAVHDFTLHMLDPALAAWEPDPAPGARHDAPKTGVHGIINRIVLALPSHVAKYTGAAFDRMSVEVNRKNADAVRLLGIRPRAIGAEDVLKRARDANIKLVENAGRVYAAQVRELFDDPENFGKTAKEMRDLLLERADVSESRAQLIARDQTLKLNAALTKDRHEKAGIARYTWSGSLDERERPMHRELEGKAFSWDDPPVTNPEGDENHPGMDYQCRCVPLPLLEDEEEPDALAEAAE